MNGHMRLVLIALAVLLAAPAAAQACKCVLPTDSSAEIEAASGAVWAKVVKRTVLGEEAVRYRLKVIVDYKDNLPERITVGARRSSAACGLELNQGEKVGLLLQRSDGKLTSNSCAVRSRAYLDGTAEASVACAA